MSAEIPASSPSPERREHTEPLTKEELRQLGHLVRVAMERDDLDEIVRQHEVETGVTNPNQHGKGLFIGQGDVPMDDASVYRSVDARAVHDLAESGVVRGAYTATEGTRANTSSHATFWNNGETGKS